MIITKTIKKQCVDLLTKDLNDGWVIVRDNGTSYTLERDTEKAVAIVETSPEERVSSRIDAIKKALDSDVSKQTRVRLERKLAKLESKVDNYRLFL